MLPKGIKNETVGTIRHRASQGFDKVLKNIILIYMMQGNLVYNYLIDGWNILCFVFMIIETNLGRAAR